MSFFNTFCLFGFHPFLGALDTTLYDKVNGSSDHMVMLEVSGCNNC